MNVACDWKVYHIGVGHFIFCPVCLPQSGYPRLNQKSLTNVLKHEVYFISSLQVGVSNLLRVEQLLLAQVQVNLLNRWIVNETQFAPVELGSFCLTFQVLVQQVNKLQLHFCRQVMHANKVVFAVVLDDCPLDEHLNFLQWSLLLAVQDLVHFRLWVALDKCKVIVFDLVASNQLDLVLVAAFLHHVCPFEPLKGLGFSFLEHPANLFNFIDGGLDSLVGVDEL